MPKPTEYHNVKIEEEKNYKLGNAQQKDFLLLLDMIKTTHPAFTKQMEAPFNLDSIRTADHSRVAKMDSATFPIYVQQILSLLHDGHSTASWGRKNSKGYPFNLYYNGKEYRLSAVDKSYEQHLGKIVAKINGIPIDQAIKKASTLFACDNDERGIYYLVNNQYLLFDDVINFISPRNDNMCVLTTDDGSEISLSPIDLKAMKSQCAIYKSKAAKRDIPFHRNNNQPFSMEIDKDLGIGYLQFFACMDQMTQRMMLKMQGVKVSREMEDKLKNFPRLDTSLRKFFHEMNSNNIKTLIVDIRDNGGGNSILCDEILSWLKPIYNKNGKEEDFKTIRSAYRYSPLAEEIYKGDIVNIRENAIRKKNNGILDHDVLYANDYTPFSTTNPSPEVYDPADSSLISLFNTNRDSVYHGKVYIIQNEGTFSSAGNFVLTANDNGIGTIIGGPSTYTTSCYGDILAWMLPNTGVMGTISWGAFYRPNMARFTEKEIVPNPLIIPSLDDHFAGNDPCMEWAIEHSK